MSSTCQFTSFDVPFSFPAEGLPRLAGNPFCPLSGTKRLEAGGEQTLNNDLLTPAQNCVIGH